MPNDPLELPRPVQERPEQLPGVTYKIKAPNPGGTQINIYLTVNEADGRPFEVFINCSDATVSELLGLTMVLISRLLRLAVPLDVIAEDLLQVTSSNTSHFADQAWHPSLIARLGRVLKAHESRRQAQLDLRSCNA